jgi:DMSO/TMAO reductase YedYZ molybdopterin-dependent catalytic subunit
MKTKMLRAVIFLVAASVLAAPPEERLRVAVPGGTPLDLGAAEIAALPHTDVRAVDSHGKGGLFRGVDLVELLHRAGAAAGDALRGSHLRDIVRVECADGYVVAFTLAELDPELGARRVLLADALDGNPLGAEQGPWRLVVPDDKRPARWARQVRKVAVVVLD